MRELGCEVSKLDGTEKDYSDFKPINGIVYLDYSCKSKLDPVRDQGSVPKCISVALTDLVRYHMSTTYGHDKFMFDDAYYWHLRKDKTVRGMSPKEALEIQVNSGVSVGMLNYTSMYYCRLKDITTTKIAIINNGPVIACFKAKSFGTDFWNGLTDYGGHAVLLTGYDSNGFELRNSWGRDYGDGGYTILPYEDFSKAYELWTLID